MIYFILCGIVVLGVFIWTFQDVDVLGYIGSFLISALFGTIGVGIVTLVFTVISMSLPGTPGETRQELRALGNSSSTSGSFFLGSGYVDERLTFSYITRDEKGGNRLESDEANDVVVYEDSEDQAYRLQPTKIVDGDWWWLAPGVTGLTVDVGTVEFHIPEGSIDSSYTISVNPSN